MAYCTGFVSYRSVQILALSTALCACIPHMGPSSAPVLRIGTSGDYAPFSLDGQGFDVRVAESFAEDLGYELVWVPFRWPELEARMTRGDFDLVMSGITWRARRSVIAPLSLAVAMGGPCLLVRSSPAERIVVNAGGFLETWVRERYPEAKLTAVTANQSLPALLASGDFDALATDSFEIERFRRPGWSARCERPIHAKAYWVSERKHANLLEQLDGWLLAESAQLATLRSKHFASEDPLSHSQQLADLIARRLALMPYVARWKRQRGVPIEDRVQEARVLERTRDRAGQRGLDADAMAEFVRLQIEYAKRVQRQTTAPGAEFDLRTQLRPRLLDLAIRMQDNVAAGASLDASAEPILRPWLSGAEIEALLAVPLTDGRP